MMAMLRNIQMDEGIRCQACIFVDTIDHYSERMAAGDDVPPVVLFGTPEKCWIGDGWHRVHAARKLGRESIDCEMRQGGRTNALIYALGAGASSGLSRSDRDKRRAAEIALREFPDLSVRAVAGLCGAGVPFVEKIQKSVLPQREEIPIECDRNEKIEKAVKFSPKKLYKNIQCVDCGAKMRIYRPRTRTNAPICGECHMIGRSQGEMADNRISITPLGALVGMAMREVYDWQHDDEMVYSGGVFDPQEALTRLAAEGRIDYPE